MPSGRLSGYHVISVTGEARTEFLNALLCADIRFAATGSCVVTAWCNAKGRVEYVLRLLFGASEIALLCRPEDTEALVSRLTLFSMRRPVEIRHATGWHAICGTGPESGETPFADMATGRWLGLVEDTGTLPDVQAKWDAGDIAALVPLPATADDRDFLPQMLNLAAIDGLSFKKGCYPGQEVVARLHFRGELKRHLAAGHAALEALPANGSALYEDLSAVADNTDPNARVKAGVVVGSAASIQGGAEAADVQMVLNVNVDSGATLWSESGAPILVRRVQAQD